MPTKQQAGIAIGVKPIAALGGMGIGALHGLKPREGRDQHEQRRTWQMEIGEENIDRAKAIARRDEDRGFVRKRLDGAVVGRGTFQQPQRGSADRDDTAAAGAGRVQGGCRLRARQPVLARCLMAHIVHVCPRYWPAHGGVELFFTKISEALYSRSWSPKELIRLTTEPTKVVRRRRKST